MQCMYVDVEIFALNFTSERLIYVLFYKIKNDITFFFRLNLYSNTKTNVPTYFYDNINGKSKYAYYMFVSLQFYYK